MIKSKTVFIVGAGASAEVGLPVGLELTKDIARLLEIREGGVFDIVFDSAIAQAIKIKTGNNLGEQNLYAAASRHINNAMPLAPSIDNFIDSQNGNEAVEFCAKLAIVRAILSAEQKSKLYFDTSNAYNTVKFDALSATWYRRLWVLLCTDTLVENVDTIFDNVAFIIFNYDRCVEQFLCGALRIYYDLDLEGVRKVMSKLKVFHPYGQVGGLPAMRQDHALGYGSEPAGRLLVSLAGQIKTFTERVDEAGELAAFRQEIAIASKLVFLGFAFHEINMKLLQVDTDIGYWKIYGTRLGVSDSDADVIDSR